MRRGASPNVPAAAVANAAGLSHAADGWSADATRSGQLPGVDVSTPGTRFGRWLLPSRLLVELLWDAPMGNPDCQVNTAAAVQPAATPAPRHTLGKLDDGGIVAVYAFAHLEHADVPKLRERTQQLSTRGRGIVPQRCAGKRRIAEERVRHRLGQDGRSQGQILRIE